MKIRDRIKKLIRVPASELIPNPRNWRLHPEEQQNALRGVLAEVGIADALIARETKDGLQLIDGHLRADVDPSLEWPVLVLDVTEAEADKILLTHDPLANMAEADEKMLSQLLEEIETESADLQKMLDELPTPAAVEIEITEDETPEPPAEPITKPGDLWALGEHRVLCGDSTKAEDVERVMGGAVADLVVADPPYGMNLDTDYSKLPSTKAEGNKNYEPVFGDDADFDYREIKLPQHSEGFWFGADYYARTLPQGGSWIVWDKRVEEQFDKMFGSAFELIWSSARHKREIIRHNCTLFSGNNEARGRVHPTTKPTAVIAWIIKRYGGRGTIFDPFLGSGTTLIAAEQLDRTCYGMEISPAYCDVIVKRWETLTGEKAKRPKRKTRRAK